MIKPNYLPYVYADKEEPKVPIIPHIALMILFVILLPIVLLLMILGVEK